MWKLALSKKRKSVLKVKIDFILLKKSLKSSTSCDQNIFSISPFFRSSSLTQLSV